MLEGLQVQDGLGGVAYPKIIQVIVNQLTMISSCSPIEGINSNAGMIHTGHASTKGRTGGSTLLQHQLYLVHARRRPAAGSVTGCAASAPRPC